MDPHTPRVKQVIKAALNDINLLRALVVAPDSAVDAVLTNYDPPYTLGTEDLAAFVKSLREGKVCITARELVDMYDDLQPPKRMRAGKDQEWVP
jgi:hypothetical protein